MRYIIPHPNNRQENTDLLGIIRKIRTHRLHKQDMLLTDANAEAKPAYQYEELYPVFIEQDQTDQENSATQETNYPTLWSHLKSGVLILKEDITSAAITGMFILTTLMLLALGLTAMPLFVYVVFVPLLSYFLFNLCLIAHLRLARVQLLPFHYIAGIIKKHGRDLCFATIPPALIAISLPWLASAYFGMAAWGIALLVGAPVIAYFMFVPLLIIDRELTISEALSLNHHIISNIGMDLFAQMIGVLLLNVLAGPFILLTLPITLLAFMQLYDTRFVEY